MKYERIKAAIAEPGSSPNEDANFLLEDAVLLSQISGANKLKPNEIVGRALLILVMAIVKIAKVGGAANADGLKRVIDMVWDATVPRALTPNSKGGSA